MTSSEGTTGTGLRPNRERWLEQATDTYWRPRFEEVGFPLAQRFHLSVGFGLGAKRENRKMLGQCWSRTQSADGVNHIFISPEIEDTADVLRTLGHELIHSALDSGTGILDGHVKRFAEIATRLGFEGPMTETPPSASLMAELFTVAEALGEYPHGALQVDTRVRQTTPVGTGWRAGGGRMRTGAPTQTNRHIKVICGTCGYAVRATHKMLQRGNPRCPAGDEMTPEI